MTRSTIPTGLPEELLSIASLSAVDLEAAMRPFEQIADSGFDRVSAEAQLLCVSAVLLAIRQFGEFPEAVRSALREDVMDRLIDKIPPEHREEISKALEERSEMYRDLTEEFPGAHQRRVGNQFVDYCDIFNSAAGVAGARTFDEVRRVSETQMAKSTKDESSLIRKRSDTPAPFGTPDMGAVPGTANKAQGNATGNIADVEDAGGSVPHMMALELGTDQMRIVREELQPIYEYYFPSKWMKVLAGFLHPRREPNYSMYKEQLADLKQRAWGISDRSKKAWETLHAQSVPDRPKAWGQLLYHQTYYDSTTVIVFADFVAAMRQGNAEEAARLFAGLREASDLARKNLSMLKEVQGRTTSRAHHLYPT